MTRKAIYWFTNDLRLHDNPGLLQAIEEYDEVIPVYIIDESLFNKRKRGPELIGPYRAKFLYETLEDLKKQLQEHGSNLIVKYGDPMSILIDLFIEYDCRRLFASYSYSIFEESTLFKLEESLPCTFTHSNLLHHPDDLPFGIDQVPDNFVEFKDAMDKNVSILNSVESCVPYFSLKEIPYEVEALKRKSDEVVVDKRSLYPFEGGETHALRRLNEYINENKSVLRFGNPRNHLNGIDFSSKFSGYLALGSLSPKLVIEKLIDFEKHVQKNTSTFQLAQELVRRDFFKYMAMKYGAKFYISQGLKDKEPKFKKNKKLFEEWKNGETKNAFVNANMKELKHTGYMSLQGRQVVATYLVEYLKLDWRLGAKYFEAMLIDFTPENNYGNWINLSGVGFETHVSLNVDEVAEKFDEDFKYRNIWLS